MTIILNKEITRNLIYNKELKVLKKYQSDKVSCNYYFTPNVGIKIYKPKVMIINEKYIVFEFDKNNSIGLYSLLKMINEEIKELIYRSNIIRDANFYDMYSDIEDGNKYTIRCSLPKFKWNYKIEYIYNTDKVPFVLPRLGCVFDEIVVEIRNVWQNNNKLGYNLELKKVIVINN